MTPARPTVDLDALAELLAAHEIAYGSPDYWRCGCGFVSERTDSRASINEHRATVIATHLAAVTAERDEARAAVGGLLAAVESMRVAYYSTDWRDQYTRADHLDAIVSAAAKCRAALDHVPTTEGGEG